MIKKIMKILGLLMFGICLLSFGFVNGVETKHIFPLSLQELTLNFIGKKKIEGNSDLFEKFKKILQENPGITFNVCKKNITDGVAKIAAIEWLKLSKKRHLPLELYKKENPVFGLLIDEEIIKYSLSINDLIDMGAQIALSQHIDGIWFLDLTGFSLTSLDGLQKVLNISFLQRLYIDNNKLKKIEPETFINLSALQELYLGNNQLEELEQGVFVDLPLLKCLSLQDNQLKKLIPGTFINLPALQVLSFENNQLKELVSGVFINLPALKCLFFQNNKLRELASRAFFNLPALESLYLEDNELENLDQEAFVNLPVLRGLYLKNNQLTFEIQRELRGLGIKYMHFNNQRTPVIEEIMEEI